MSFVTHTDLSYVSESLPWAIKEGCRRLVNWASAKAWINHGRELQMSPECALRYRRPHTAPPARTLMTCSVVGQDKRASQREHSPPGITSAHCVLDGDGCNGFEQNTHPSTSKSN